MIDRFMKWTRLRKLVFIYYMKVPMGLIREVVNKKEIDFLADMSAKLTLPNKVLFLQIILG